MNDIAPVLCFFFFMDGVDLFPVSCYSGFCCSFLFASLSLFFSPHFAELAQSHDLVNVNCHNPGSESYYSANGCSSQQAAAVDLVQHFFVEFDHCGGDFSAFFMMSSPFVVLLFLS